MLRAIRSLINYGEVLDTAVGVNIRFLPDGTRQFSYCVLKKQKELIVLAEHQSGIDSAEQLLSMLTSHLEKGVGMSVNAEGRQVLTKSVARGEGGSDFRKQFPGAREEDFVVQQYEGASTVFFSLFRKADLVKEIIVQHPAVMSVSLGSFILDTLAPLVDKETIVLRDKTVSFIGQRLVEVNENAMDVSVADTVDVSGESVPASILMAYALAWNQLFPVDSLTVSGLPHVQAAEEKRVTKRQLFYSARFALLSVLAVLFVNAMVFSWLNQTVRESEEAVSLYSGQSTKQQQTHTQSVALSQAYEKLGWVENRVPLYYADQLAATVPVEIRLSILEIGTADEHSVRRDKRRIYDAAGIRIKGTTTDPAALSQWIGRLLTLPWIAAVDNQKYQYDPRSEKGIFEFQIRVK